MNSETARKILEVELDAEMNVADLKEFYKKACLKHHPDKGGNNESFRMVKQAYDYILANFSNMIIEIVGVIHDVVLINNDRNRKKVTIGCNKPDTDIRTCILNGFYPLKKGDVISGHVNTEKGVFISPPVIQIKINRGSVLQMLASFRIRGVMPTTWDRVYDTVNILCKDNASEVVNTFSRWAHIYQQTKNLDKILPPTLVAKLNEAQWKQFLTRWNEAYSMRSLYLLGLTNKEIRSSEESPDVLYVRCMENPWSVHSIPLEKCEWLDRRLGRVSTAEQWFCGKLLRHVVQRTHSGIHTHVTIYDTKKMFPEIDTYHDVLIEKYRLIFDNNRIYFAPIFEQERVVVEFFVRLMLQTDPGYIEPVFEMTNLSNEQKEAITLALNSNLSFYTGQAGSGKTTILKEIVKNNDMNHVEYILASFTGKAVSRCKQVCNRPAYTLDRLLAGDLLDDTEHLLIDEISMTSLSLLARVCHSLLPRKRLPKVTLIGDQNQLPPISYGFPFREIIKVQDIPRVILTKNHRLETLGDVSEHGVMLACEAVLNPPTKLESCETFNIIFGDHKSVKRIFKQFKDDGYTQDDVCCITPYREAVKHINAMASLIFHSDCKTFAKDCTDPDITIGKITWRLGDKVIVQVNLYNIDVMNGECGVVEKIDEQYVYVSFCDGRKKAQFKYVKAVNENGEPEEDNEFDFEAVDFVGLETEHHTGMIAQAYAITVHKSQGSEYNYAIYYYPYVQAKGIFICKEFVYTQFSRSKIAGYLVVPKDDLRNLEVCCSKSSIKMRLDVTGEKISKLYKEKLEEINSELNMIPVM